ncbi:MAG: hypothetical protein QG639_568, partial [Patescibacteria group bacterium]|nr:hypothetical protein [Patescibacteria group bacterium]
LYSQKLQQVSELPEYIKHGVPYTQATYEEITGDLIEKQLPNGYMLLLK